MININTIKVIAYAAQAVYYGTGIASQISGISVNQVKKAILEKELKRKSNKNNGGYEVIDKDGNVVAKF